MAGQQAELEWRDGVPVSTRFADPYYSLDDGLAETRHVFLAGNGLPDRLSPGFHVAELGIGTGLNLLALLALVRETGAARSATPASRLFRWRQGHARRPRRLPRGRRRSRRFVAAVGNGGPFGTPEIEADFHLRRRARRPCPRGRHKADAWFLDGFAPARNPELWEPALLAEVARHTAPGGTPRTYSAAARSAGGLAAARLRPVERRPGYGRKRHMTAARLP